MLIAFGVSLVIMMIVGFPIYLSLIGASCLYIFLNPNLSFLAAAQKMIAAPDSFTLIAIPFFIFSAQIMNTGGISKRIFDFSKAAVGHLRGGLGYVNVLASIIFSGMSGSAAADAGGLGLIEIYEMRRAGYEDDFTIGVTASSSLIGPIIPPSIPFVIYGAVANVSVGGLFLGGVIPGLLMGLILFVYVYIVAKKRNYPIETHVSVISYFKNLLTETKKSFFSLLTPLIIIVGMWKGLFTPTEAAVICIVYAIIITIFLYKDQTWKDLFPAIMGVIKMVPQAILIVAGANLFGWILSYEKIDHVLMNLLFGLTSNKYVILLIINFLLLLMGCFLEVTSAIMILLPIIQPIVSALGVHPVHLGVVMVLNLMLGLLTPPVGNVLYILSIVADVPVKKVIRYVTPWIFPIFISLILITYLPELVLWLPRILGFI